MSSTVSFNLDQSKSLSSGYGLNNPEVDSFVKRGFNGCWHYVSAVQVFSKGEISCNEMLVTIFSPFPTVFFFIKNRNNNFSNIWFVLWKCFEFGLVQKFVIW